MVDKSNPKTIATTTGPSSSSSTTMWSNKPVKMRLFGAWEIGRTPSDCIPRLCSLNITRLTLNKSLGNDVGAIMVAVKMQNSKRMLRSNEITIPSFNNEQTSTFDIELDLYCELQYIHFIKRNRNYLQIFLQRRKKYKNKAILGFKTLACGLIDMLEVLQQSTISEKQLDLIGRVKDTGKNDVIARITISSLKSQPIDQESNPRRGKVSIDRPDVYSDDEEFTSAEDGSDSETIEEGNNVSFRRKLNEHKSRKQLFSNNEKFGRSVVSTNVQQRNFKQKFISLLKKFRLPDSEAYDSEEKFQEALEKELMSSTQEPPDIDDLFDDEEIDDLDYLTDSGQEFDDVSISSTPKPSLRPFFSSCTLVGQDKSYQFPIVENNKKQDESQETSGTEGTPETSDTSQKQITILEESKKRLSFDKEPSKRVRLFPKEKSESKNSQKEKKSLHATMSLLSTTNYPKEDNTSKEFIHDQLNKVFPVDDQNIPEEIIFLNLSECNPLHTQSFLQLFERTHHIVGTNTLNDIKFSFNFLCNKIQKFCNNNMKILSPIRIALIGSDSYVNSFLRFYVDSLAIKSPEWQNFLRFYIIPFTYQSNHSSIMLHKYLSSIDSVYSNIFFNNPINPIKQKDLDSSRIISGGGDNNNNTTSITTSLLSEANNLYMHEFYNKVVNFMNNAQTMIQIPIAEAMIAYKDKNVDDESNQVLIPFICDVKIGLADNTYGNHSMEEEYSSNVSTSGSIAQASSVGSGDKFITSPTSIKDHQQQHHHSNTPPNSPSITSAQQQQTFNKSDSLFCNLNEAIDLQVDYWTFQPKLIESSSSSSTKKSDNCKFTLKNSFRNVQILRLPNYGEIISNSLTFSYVTKEKKQKIMRLGKKKEKDVENKCQVIEGICRLVCSYKTSQSPIKAIVDGIEYSGVKFFQLTPQWQTQIKYFPIVIFSNNFNNHHQEKDSSQNLTNQSSTNVINSNNSKAQQK